MQRLYCSVGLWPLIVSLLLLCSPFAAGQSSACTVSPNSSSLYSSCTAFTAGFSGPDDVTVDVSGSIYVADTGNNRVVVLSSTGAVSDVTFEAAAGLNISYPTGVAVDSAGNVFVADNGNQRIVKYSPTGTALAVITSTTPALLFPGAVAVDSSNNLYISDSSNNAIIKMTPTAGSPNTYTQTYEWPLANPYKVAVDSAGDLYVANPAVNGVEKISPNGTQLAVFNTSNLLFPDGVALDSAGNVYVTNSDGSPRAGSVMKFSPSGAILATLTTSDPALEFPRGMWVDSSNNVWVADTSNNRVVVFAPAVQTASSSSTTVSVSASSSSTSTTTSSPSSLLSASSVSNVLFSSSSSPSAAGAATLASFSYSGAYLPEWLALDRSDALYVVDFERTTIKVLASIDNSSSPHGTVLRTLHVPSAYTLLYSLVLDPLDNLYVLAAPSPDSTDVLVMSSSNGSLLHTVLGTTLGLSFAYGIDVDAANNVYIADSGNNRVLVLAALDSATPLQLLYTLTSSSSPLNYPNDVCVDADFNVYVADTGNNRVVMLSGTGTAQPGSLLLSAPIGAAGGSDIVGVAVDPTNSLLYVSDNQNNALLVLSAWYSDAPLVQLLTIAANGPAGVRVDGQGRSYLITADKNITVRAAIGHAAAAPSSSTSATSASSSTAAVSLSTSASASSSVSTSLSASSSSQSASAASSSSMPAPTSSSSSSPSAAGAATLASFSYSGAYLPEWLALDRSDALYVVDFERTTIKVLASIDNSSSPHGTVLRTLHVPSAYTLLYSLVLDPLDNLYVLAAPSPDSTDVLVMSSSNGSLLHTVLGTTLGLSFAYGIDVDAANNVYIADSGNNRVLVLAALDSATPLQLLYTLTSSSSPLNYPNDVCVDADFNVYVADTGNNRVVMLSGTGTAQPGSLLLSAPIGAAGGSDIVGVAVDPTNSLLYVSDNQNNALLVLSAWYSDAPLVQLLTIAANGPAGVRVDGQGRSYLITADKNITVRAAIGHAAAAPSSSTSATSASSSTAAVSLSTSASASSSVSTSLSASSSSQSASAASSSSMPAPTSSSSSSPSAAGAATLASFSYSGAYLPEWLALDRSDALYVVDFERTTIKVLASIDNSSSPHGTVLRTLHVPSAYTLLYSLVLDPLDNLYVLAAPSPDSTDVLVMSSSNGSLLHTVLGTTLGLSFAYGIDVDAANNVYIADSGNNRVLVLAALDSATPLQLLYTLTSSSSPLNYPNDVCVDADFNVYVADTGNNRVVMLSGTGTAQPGSLLLSAPIGAAGGSDIVGVAVDPTNSLLYVSDNQNNALLVLSAWYSDAPLVQLLTIAANGPAGVRVDGQGRSYLITADKNITVRAAIGHAAAAPSSSTSATSASSSTAAVSLSTSASASSSVSTSLSASSSSQSASAAASSSPSSSTAPFTAGSASSVGGTSIASTSGSSSGNPSTGSSTANATTAMYFCYYLQQDSPVPAWNVSASGSLTVTGPVMRSGAAVYTVVSISGVRTQWESGSASSSVSITGLVGGYDNTANTVWPFLTGGTYSGYSAAGGIAYTVSSPVTLPTTSNATSTINIVSHPIVEQSVGLGPLYGGLSYFVYVPVSAGVPNCSPASAVLYSFHYFVTPTYNASSSQYLYGLWSACVHANLSVVGPYAVPSSLGSGLNSVLVVVGAVGERYIAATRDGFNATTSALTGVGPEDGGDFMLYGVGPLVSPAGITFRYSSPPPILTTTGMQPNNDYDYLNVWAVSSTLVNEANLATAAVDQQVTMPFPKQYGRDPSMDNYVCPTAVVTQQCVDDSCFEAATSSGASSSSSSSAYMGSSTASSGASTIASSSSSGSSSTSSSPSSVPGASSSSTALLSSSLGTPSTSTTSTHAQTSVSSTGNMQSTSTFSSPSSSAGSVSQSSSPAVSGSVGSTAISASSPQSSSSSTTGSVSSLSPLSSSSSSSASLHASTSASLTSPSSLISSSAAAVTSGDTLTTQSLSAPISSSAQPSAASSSAIITSAPISSSATQRLSSSSAPFTSSASESSPPSSTSATSSALFSAAAASSSSTSPAASSSSSPSVPVSSSAASSSATSAGSQQSASSGTAGSVSGSPSSPSSTSATAATSSQSSSASRGSSIAISASSSSSSSPPAGPLISSSSSTSSSNSTGTSGGGNSNSASSSSPSNSSVSLSSSPSTTFSPPSSSSSSTSAPPPSSAPALNLTFPVSVFTTSSSPAGLALDSSNNLYVADLYLRGVYKVSPNGTQLAEIGAGIGGPIGVALDSSSNVWVACLQSGTAIQFSPNGVQLAVVNTPGNVGAVYIALDTADNVYVTTESMTAYKFDTHTAPASLALNFTLPSTGTYGAPEGIVVDGAGMVYIADQNNQRVVKFHPDGTVAAIWLTGRTPMGLALSDRYSASADLFVAFAGNAAPVVQRRATADGSVLTNYFTTPMFGSANGIAVSNDTVYVASYNNIEEIISFPISAPSTMLSSSSSSVMSSSAASASSLSASSLPSSSSSVVSVSSSLSSSLSDIGTSSSSSITSSSTSSSTITASVGTSSVSSASSATASTVSPASSAVTSGGPSTANATTAMYFCYYLQQDSPVPAWNVSASGSLTVTGPVMRSGAAVYTVVGISGVRTQWESGSASSSVSITGLVGGYDNTANTVWPFLTGGTYSGYSAAGGIAYTVSSPVTLPTTSNATSTINIVSHPIVEQSVGLGPLYGGLSYFVYVPVSAGVPNCSPASAVLYSFHYFVTPTYNASSSQYLYGLWSACVHANLSVVGPYAVPSSLGSGLNSVLVVVGAVGERYIAATRDGFNATTSALTGVGPEDGGDFMLYGVGPLVSPAGITFRYSSPPPILTTTGMQPNNDYDYLNVWAVSSTLVNEANLATTAVDQQVTMPFPKQYGRDPSMDNYVCPTAVVTQQCVDDSCFEAATSSGASSSSSSSAYMGSSTASSGASTIASSSSSGSSSTSTSQSSRFGVSSSGAALLSSILVTSSSSSATTVTQTSVSPTSSMQSTSSFSSPSSTAGSVSQSSSAIVSSSGLSAASAVSQQSSSWSTTGRASGSRSSTSSSAIGFTSSLPSSEGSSSAVSASSSSLSCAPGSTRSSSSSSSGGSGGSSSSDISIGSSSSPNSSSTSSSLSASASSTASSSAASRASSSSSTSVNGSSSSASSSSPSSTSITSSGTSTTSLWNNTTANSSSSGSSGNTVSPALTPSSSSSPSDSSSSSAGSSSSSPSLSSSYSSSTNSSLASISSSSSLSTNASSSSSSLSSSSNTSSSAASSASYNPTSSSSSNSSSSSLASSSSPSSSSTSASSSFFSSSASPSSSSPSSSSSSSPSLSLSSSPNTSSSTSATFSSTTSSSSSNTSTTNSSTNASSTLPTSSTASVTSSSTSISAAVVQQCMTQWSVVSAQCGLTNYTAGNDYCSLGCAAVYPAFVSTCLATGVLTSPAQFVQVNATLAAFGGLCAPCIPAVVSAVAANCGLGVSIASVTATSSDPLLGATWPASCSDQCAAVYGNELLPFYDSCIAPYPQVDAAAQSFLASCAPAVPASAVSSIATFVINSTAVSLSWPLPSVTSARSAANLTFTLTRTLNGSGNSAETVYTGSSTSYVDSSMLSSAVYVYSVVSQNSAGWSNATFQTVSTPSSPPPAPTAVVLNSVANTTATLSWSAVTSTDASALSYIVFLQQVGSALPPLSVYLGVSPQLTLTNLLPFTSYAAWVSSSTVLAGAGPSQKLSFTTKAGVPASVQALATASLNSSSITLTWQPPSSSGATSIANYSITLSSLTLPQTTTVITTRINVTFSGLAAASAVTVQVVAVNDQGLAGLASSISAVTAALPPTIRQPVVASVLGSSTAALSWNLSSAVSDGGSPITSVRVVYAPAAFPNSSVSLSLPVTAQQTTLTGLSNHTAYIAQWQVQNSYGASALSATTSFITLQSAPTIMSFVAGDSTGKLTSLGVGSNLTITFSSAVSAPAITTQAGVDAVFVFSPPIPGNYTGVWNSAFTNAVVVLSAVTQPALVSSFAVGLVTVSVRANLTSSSGTSASALGQVSPPLSGSFYGAPRTSHYLSVQPPLVVLEDSTLNAFSASCTLSIPLDTLTLTLNSTRGQLAIAFPPFGVTILTQSTNSLVITLPPLLMDLLCLLDLLTYTPQPLSTLSDAIVVTLSYRGVVQDSTTIPVTVLQVNHQPSFAVNGTLAPFVVGEAYSLPAIVVADFDVSVAPTWPMSVFVRDSSSTTATFSLNPTALAGVPSSVAFSITAGSQATSLTVTGPLAALNAVFATGVVVVTDASVSATSTTKTFSVTVNDEANGGTPAMTTTQSITVAVSCSGSPAPQMTSAVFSNDASQVVIGLDSPADQSSAANATCASYFSSATLTLLGSGAACQLNTPTSLVISLGYAPTLLPGQSMVLSGSAIRRCPAGQSASSSIIVTAPLNAVAPVVSVLGPTSISACDDLLLTAQATGLGGRAATYTWSILVGSTSNISTASAAPSILNLVQSLQYSVTISATTLYQAPAYYFVLVTVSNFLGKQTTQSITVYKSPLALPLLTVQGTSNLSVVASSPISVAIIVQLPTCVAQSVLSSNFSWTITPPPPTATLSAVKSLLTTAQLALPPSTLSPGSYVLTLTVTNGALLNQLNVSLAVLRSPLVLRLSAGTQQSISQASNTVLASTAIDPDVSVFNSSAWTFAWSCSVSQVVGSVTPCYSVQGAVFAVSKAQNQTITAGQLAPGSYNFTLTAINALRTATASVLLIVVANPIPTMSIQTYGSVVTTSSTLKFSAVAVDSSNTTLSYVWSQVSGPTVSLAALASPAYGVTSTILVLNNAGSAVFSGGATYAFQVAVRNGLNQSSSAQVTVQIAAPPSGGSLTVSPTVGNELNTTFSMQAIGWQSAAGLSLSYQWYYLPNNGSSKLQLSQSTPQSFYSSQLPQGSSAPLYNLTVLLVVTDTQQGVTTQSVNITVKPNSALASDSTGLQHSNLLTTGVTTASQTGDQSGLLSTVASVVSSAASGVSGALHIRRLLSFSAMSLPTVIALNSEGQKLVAATLPRTNFATGSNAALLGVANPTLVTTELVSAIAASVLSSLTTLARANTGSSGCSADNSACTSVAQSQQSALIQLTGAYMATLATSSNATFDLSAQLIANLSAQCDAYSTNSNLQVAGQTYTVTSPAVVVSLGRNAASDSVSFTAEDGVSGVSFAANSILGANDGSGVAVQAGDFIDSRYWLWLSNPYTDLTQPISSVLYAARTSASASPLSFVSSSVHSMTITLPYSNSTCAPGTCYPQCYYLDDSASSWLNDSFAITSVIAADGSSTVSCSVYGLAEASVALFAQDGTPLPVETTSSAASSSSSSSSSPPIASTSSALSSSGSHTLPAPSSSISAPSSSSSSAPTASLSSSTATSAIPNGSLVVSFQVSAPTSVSGSASQSVFETSFALDVADNVGRLFGLGESQLAQYVEPYSLSLGARRRLLQTSMDVSVLVLSSITSVLGSSSTAASVVDLLQALVTAHAFTTTRSNATVPASQTLTVTNLTSSTSSSSSSSSSTADAFGSTPSSDHSSSLSTAQLAGIIGGCVVGAALIIAIVAYIVRQANAHHSNRIFSYDNAARRRSSFGRGLMWRE